MRRIWFQRGSSRRFAALAVGAGLCLAGMVAEGAAGAEDWEAAREGGWRLRELGSIPERLPIPPLQLRVAVVDSGVVGGGEDEAEGGGGRTLDGERIRREAGVRGLDDALARLPGVVRR